MSVRDGMFTTQYLQGGSGQPLLFLHGAGGMSGPTPLLDRLAERFTVYAPWHPGFGPSVDDLDKIDDLLDLSLYYQDLLDALGLERPVVVGHSFGGMIAAEMAAICSPCLDKLVLIAPAGLWRDDVPVADFFTMSPSTMAPLIWHDPESPVAKAASTPPETQEQTMAAMLARAQAMAAAGKFLWPIPDKGLKKRIHRIKAPTLILWGESDGLVPAVYAEDFHQKIAGSQLTMIPEAAHMVVLEQAEKVAQAIIEFAR